jgi:hypothetical protein
VPGRHLTRYIVPARTWRYQIRKKRGARRRVRSVERNMDGEAML